MKIPLEGTIGSAYRFLFSNLLSIVGTVWLPFTAAAGLIGGIAFLVLPLNVLHGEFPPMSVEGLLPLFMALLALQPFIILAWMLAGAMVAVALTERGLGIRKGVTLVYFSLGAPVWRMLGAFILAALAILALFTCAVCAAVLAVTLSRWWLPASFAALAGLAAIAVATCGWAYTSVRLVYFLPAVVVAEKRIGFGRSWQLGRGNFWRIVIVAAAIFIPVGFVANLVFQIVAVGLDSDGLRQWGHLGWHFSPGGIAVMFRELLAVLWPLILLNMLVQLIARSGLWYGALGHAYLATKANPESARSASGGVQADESGRIGAVAVQDDQFRKDVEVGKIPVWKTITAAYRFTFAHLGTIIGLIWLPTLLLTVATFFLLNPYYRASEEALANGFTSPGGLLALGALFVQIFGFFVTAMNAVAVTREALGLRNSDSVLLHFAIGPSEFRVVGVLLIVLGLFILFAIAYLVGVGVLGGIVGTALKGAGVSGEVTEIVASLLVLAGFCALIYAMVRISFLVVPATVAEGKIGVIRGWQLGSGNFWRMFAIQAVTLLPLVLLVLAAQIYVLGVENVIPGMDVLKDQESLQRFSNREMQAISSNLPLIMGINFLVAPFAYGLFFAPSAVAYRALVPAESAMTSA